MYLQTLLQAEVAALEQAASRERRSHQHLLAAARADAEQRLAAALAVKDEVHRFRPQHCPAHCVMLESLLTWPPETRTVRSTVQDPRLLCDAGLCCIVSRYRLAGC